MPAKRLTALMEQADGTQLSAGESHVGARTFLNRDDRMLELPDELSGMPRYSFTGGDGDNVRLRFRRAAVVFAAFDYNNTGLWSFEDDRPATEFGWHLWRKEAYRGSSNAEKDGKPHRASIWFREFKPEQELTGLPHWWLCLGVVDLKTARGIKGFKAGLATEVPPPVRHFSHASEAARIRPLAVPEFASVESFRQWQTRQRKRFVDRMLYPYEGKVAVSAGPGSQSETHRRREFHVTIDGQRLFRFFRLEPRAARSAETRATRSAKPRPTIVCFMGHGKVAQILDDKSSYQHACAANFAKAGYLVYAMENIGMEPGRSDVRPSRRGG